MHSSIVNGHQILMLLYAMLTPIGNNTRELQLFFDVTHYSEAPVAQPGERLTTNPTTPEGLWFGYPFRAASCPLNSNG